PSMAPSFLDLGMGRLTDAQWLETAGAAAIVAGAVVVALVVSTILGWLTRHTTHEVDPALGGPVVRALRAPAVALVLVQGLAPAVAPLSCLDPSADLARRLWLATTLAILAIALQRVLVHTLHWYARPATGRGSRLDARTLPMLRRVVSLVVWL